MVGLRREVDLRMVVVSPRLEVPWIDAIRKAGQLPRHVAEWGEALKVVSGLGPGSVVVIDRLGSEGDKEGAEAVFRAAMTSAAEAVAYASSIIPGTIAHPTAPIGEGDVYQKKVLAFDGLDVDVVQQVARGVVKRVQGEIVVYSTVNSQVAVSTGNIGLAGGERSRPEGFEFFTKKAEALAALGQMTRAVVTCFEEVADNLAQHFRREFICLNLRDGQFSISSLDELRSRRLAVVLPLASMESARLMPAVAMVMRALALTPGPESMVSVAATA